MAAASGPLPLENWGADGAADALERRVLDLLRKGNLPQAEVLLRCRLDESGPEARALNILGWIAATVQMPAFAAGYFRQASELAPDWQLPQDNLAHLEPLLRETVSRNGSSGRFLFIKAWGYGFWSDVAHVLGQLLLAELTGRTPIVQWGADSLFWDGRCANAFESYFEPVSPYSVRDVEQQRPSIWPPKWNLGNLTAREVNKWNGPFARIAALYLLGRREQLLVSDFFTSVRDLRPWIPAESPLHVLSVDALYGYLAQKYLDPQPQIRDAVERFHAAHLAAGDYVAVHARGSDKAREVQGLEHIHAQYEGVIDTLRTTHGIRRIFLLTDDARLREAFGRRYGMDLVCTDCLRTASLQGLHYQAIADRQRLGIEVMVDTYLATRARGFVGNGCSSVSHMVRYLRDWPDECALLLGPNLNHAPNLFLHDW